jgi:hypothetical protein
VGADAAFRVEQTALALEAVGAPRVAARVRAARDDSPLGRLFDRPGDVGAVREFMAQVDPAQVLEQLRANLARGQRDLAAAAGLPVPPKPPVPPDADIESWEQVEHLLGQYVREHAADLRADVEKYGDARTRPGFDPQKRLEELGRLYRREVDREFQQQHVNEMRQLTQELERQLAGKPNVKPAKVAAPRRRFLQGYRQYAGRPADELLPAMQEWLEEARQFQDRYPNVFRPRPVADEALLKRLADLGPYEVDIDSSRVQVSWDAPRGLECDWTTFSLSLEFPPKDEDVLRRLLDACDRLRETFPQHQETMRRAVLEHFDTYKDWFEARSLTWSEVDDTENPTERAVLEKAGGGSIRVEVPEWDEDGAVVIEVFFGVEWYEEHGLELSLPDDLAT